MKYDGIKLQEFTSDKTIVFDPPKKMLVWDIEDSMPIKRNVYAYLPKRDFPVKGAVSEWRHCAELPEEPKPRRATNRELAKWLTQGNGELSGKTSSGVWSEHVYDKDKPNKACSEHLVIRKWNTVKWHEPTVDYMGLED